jgi:cell division septation protein DedD
MYFSRLVPASLVVSFAALSVPLTAGAQSAKDSALYVQAQQMVANGDAAAGRKLADSVAAVAPAGSPAFAEGLYWRATLAANARDSEQEYRQIIVDYPLSGRVPDALLRLGELEAARGENAAALQHFQRLVLEHPLSPLRPEASYWVAKMYFDANDAPHACVANADAVSSVRASNIELKNRIDFQQQRCRGVALATTAPPQPVAVPVDKAPPARASQPAVASKGLAKGDMTGTRDTITKRAPEKRVASSAEISRSPEIRKTPEVKPEGTPEFKPEVKPKRAAATEVASAVTATAPAGMPAPPTPPKPPAHVEPADTPATLPPASSGLVTRQPTQEEVDRALASSRQARLLRPTTPSPAPVKANTVLNKRVSKGATVKGTKPNSVAKRATPHEAEVARNSEATPPSGGYAIQVAAFGTRTPATLLVAKLRGRGYTAYIDGSSAPYRVRIGHYTTHSAAAAELAKLKAKRIDGFVAER